MPKFSEMKSQDLVRLLESHGFTKSRQKGSHLVMINEANNRQVVVYMHSRPLKKGTVHTILKRAGVDINLL